MVPANPAEEDIFDAASQVTPGPDRSAYLDRVCHGDAALRQRIEGLLEVAGDAADFFGSRREEPEGRSNGRSSEPELGSLGEEVVTKGEAELSPGTSVGGYCLGERIGEGGFGEVYAATQTKPVRRKVALKIIKPGMDSRQVLARFELERQALALMDHPAIARVLDAGTAENGRPFFVMDLIQGQPITTYCDHRGLGIEARLILFNRVCQAIQHAHQKGVVHRDIKPSNILVGEQDGAPAPRVIDFGIAKAIEEDLTGGTVFTQGGQVLGTPVYMSPEQAGLDGLDIDTRSDVYALGVLLYELLVGNTPFETSELLGAGVDEMRRKLRELEPPRPSTRLTRLDPESQTARAERRGCGVPHLLRTVRGDLDWIVMKCLEKDRARRYPTVNGLAADIERYLNNDPVVARPPSATYRAIMAVRRNRTLFAAAGVIVAVLLCAVALTARQAREATRARDEVLRANAALEKETQRAEEERDKARVAQAAAEAERWATVRQVYPRLMRQAQDAWRFSDYERLREFLHEAESSPDRGFEWFHWQRALHLEEVILRGHEAGLNLVDYRRDGRRVATAGADGEVVVWRAEDGRELFRFHAHGAGVASLRYMPDGRQLLTGSADQTLRLWDAETGRQVRLVGRQSSGISCATVSPDGRRVGSVSERRLVNVWDLSEGREPRTLGPFSEDIVAAAFFPDSRRIALGGTDGALWFVDVDTAREVFDPIRIPKGIVALVVHPDGKRVAAADEDHIIHVLDPDGGRVVQRMIGHGRDGRIRVLSLSLDGRRLMSASVRRTVRVWDFETGQVLNSLQGLSGFIESGAISPDGRRAAIGGSDGRFRLWGIAGSPHQRSLSGHRARVTALAFTPDGRRLISGAEEGNLKAWDVLSGLEELTFTGHGPGITAIAMFPEGGRVLSGDGDGALTIWDIRTGSALRRLVGHQNPVTAVALAPDGEQVFSGCVDGEVKMWNASTGEPEGSWIAHSGGICSLAYLPNDGRVVSAGNEGYIKVWESTTGSLRGSFYTRSEGFQRASRLTPEPWANAGFQGSEFEHRVAVSPDGAFVAATHENLELRLWELASHRAQVDFHGIRAAVNVLAFSPDGSRLISGEGLLSRIDEGIEAAGGSRGSLKVWDTATGREMLSLWPHATGVSAAAFSPNGRWLASGGEDGSIVVYGSAQGAREEAPETTPVAIPTLE